MLLLLLLHLFTCILENPSHRNGPDECRAGDEKLGEAEAFDRFQRGFIGSQVKTFKGNLLANGMGKLRTSKSKEQEQSWQWKVLRGTVTIGFF